MKCFECKYKRPTKSLRFKYYCSKWQVHCLDDISGCIHGEPIKIDKNKVQY